MSNSANIIEKIKNKEAVVGVIGLGYVGLPLALCFAEKGFKAIGFDIDQSKVNSLEKNQSYIKHIPSARIEKARVAQKFFPTADFSRLSECDAILIAVPTPLNKNREPDMTYVVSTCESITPRLRKGQLVVLESTTYPGTTEELVVPILAKSGMKVDKDFFVAYSPEREDPNNGQYTTETIPKVVGATSDEGLAVAEALYQHIVVRTVPVSSTRVAEATKLMENIFRSVNIALVNELKVTFMKMGIDIWEVIEAAKTKPFGYMPFYPGPGLGGHCIPIDPFYLTWKAREYGVATRFIELAGEINTSMPDFVVNRVMEVLNEHGKPLRGSRILILGIAYKANVDDDRESPSYRVMEQLEERGAIVCYNDPYVPVIKHSREYPGFAGRKSVEVTAKYDLILIATAHDAFKKIDFVKLGVPVIDTRNILGSMNGLVARA
ncbi:MAG: UDP-N-acetyl-D-glucosamine dehydrogenase [Bacteroidia bacterium]|nr:MAG: UDP-N-acetyl-D-glucosamine dehydrogenase [Bacteroidia bacterium]